MSDNRIDPKKNIPIVDIEFTVVPLIDKNEVAHDMPFGGKLDSRLTPSFEILQNLSMAS
jgi:hypothetical protein